ncbi:M16 family metallopeptidase [Rhodospirillaceae bacterium SYSU D60014]|uniref:M16 family metallopeptidase n=1 Tax=Virgifigura deserti TaxID=2268457 RepID=UPI000E664E2E
MIRSTLARRLCLSALFAFTLVGAGPAPAAVFNPETFTLDNGLQVVVVPNHRAPVVTHMVWYRVGAADEPLGNSGIAHFLEHLMFKGTETMPPGAFSSEVARLGGNENAFTAQDYTAYFQTVAAEHLETMMRFEADRMANLALTDEHVLPERQVILEERRQRVENDPGAQLSEMMRASLFLHHPYGTPIIGWEHEMRGLTTADALAFYEKWYTPNNAIVVISGDVTAEEVRPMAERTYGQVPRRAVPERKRVEEPAQTAPRRVVLESAQVQQPSWSRLYLAPSYNRDPENAAYALEVLAEILGDGPPGRLYRGLVVEDKVATSAGAYYSADAFDLGTFGFYGSPLPGAEIEPVEAAIDAAIDRLLKEGVTEAEVEAAKGRLQAGAVKARDSLFGPARTFGAALTTGSTIEDVESWPERIGAVTVEQVNEAARAVLTPETSVTGLLLPKPTS